MSVRGYILVETEVGRTQAVGRAMRDLVSELATVNAVDTVTGPYDVIVQLEAPDLDQLGKCITGELQSVAGVQRTTTCLAVAPSGNCRSGSCRPAPASEAPLPGHALGSPSPSPSPAGGEGGGRAGA